MNDTTRDELERRIADIIHDEICGYVPSTDPILYLEGDDHKNQLESVTREVIREIVAARDAEIRERLLSEEAVDAGGRVFIRYGWVNKSRAKSMDVIEAALAHIGLGSGTGGQG